MPSLTSTVTGTSITTGGNLRTSSSKKTCVRRAYTLKRCISQASGHKATVRRSAEESVTLHCFAKYTILKYRFYFRFFKTMTSTSTSLARRTDTDTCTPGECLLNRTCSFLRLLLGTLSNVQRSKPRNPQLSRNGLTSLHARSRSSANMPTSCTAISKPNTTT